MGQHNQRVVSGMRPSGRLHLGHYHGVLKNWTKLQHEHECFFFVADWHVLTTHYDEPEIIEQSVWDMVIDWLAAGINPSAATLFIQSKIPEHAELNLLLSMITPLSWLERAPTYKEQQQKLSDKDLSTLGFLGYPLLQTADIAVYKASAVPVGADQVPHVELSREITRRFNHIYGKDKGFEDKAIAAVKKLGKKNAKLYTHLRRDFLQEGNDQSLETAQALVEGHASISLSDKERLIGYLDGGGKIILPEPQALLTPISKMPGLDGQKMSKSYNNTIEMREASESVESKLKRMKTDPARGRLSDPGNPDNCPVWQLHEVYSAEDVKAWVKEGCTTAGIGCLDCKRPIIDSVLKETSEFRRRACEFEESPEIVRGIIAEGSERARDVAKETMVDVRQAMGLSYR